MRRNYISPEFTYKNVFGTYNMNEQSSFFGSKMLEIEDSIYISDNNIIYYQNLENEQLDILIENSLQPLIYNAGKDKEKNQTIIIDDSQSQYQKENQTKWIMNIDLSSILTNYIFASLKQARTFEGVKNNMTLYNDVTVAMKEYITTNVLNRYKYSKIDLYLKYNDLRNQYALRYKNNWNNTIISDTNLVKRLQTETSYDYSSVRVLFNQEKPSSQYSFDYYFNILFEKI
jgi:hypothetical protein